MELSHIEFVGSTAKLQGGSVFIGASHVSVLLSNVSMTDGSAESGGGLYLDAFSTDVQLSSCQIVQNRAIVAGGLASFAYELVVQDSFIDTNSASTSHGGMLVQEALGYLVLQNSTVSRNEAGSTPGGLGISTSVNITIDACEFEQNQVQRGSGGALYVTDSEPMQVKGSVFNGNVVLTGSGSAMYVRASLLSLSSNVFSSNQAFDGGTLFWEHASGMQEPGGLHTAGNVFDDSNEAGYGPHWATEAHHLRLFDDVDVYTIEDYEAFAPEVGVTLEDVYNQTVATDSTTLTTVDVPVTINASCYDGPGFVSGSTTLSLMNGTASFASLDPLCAPNHSLGLSATALLDTVSSDVTFEFVFRACTRGEYYEERICNPCPEGSYSFADPDLLALSEMTKAAVCQSCPSEAYYCYKDTIKLKQGYWRNDNDSTHILECVWDKESCNGGEVSGDASCGSGYHGPLCAVCDDEHHFVSSSATCEACNDTSSFLDPFTVTVVALVLIAMVVAVYSVRKKIIREEKVTSLDDFLAIFLMRINVYDSDKYAAEKANA